MKVDAAAAEIAPAEAAIWRSVGVRKRGQLDDVLGELLDYVEQ